MSDYPTQGLPIQQGNGGYDDGYYDGRSRSPMRTRRRRRGPFVFLAAIIVLLVLLVVADRVAVAYAENQAATQIKNQGLSTKPTVSIEGFPFLTQVATRHLNEIQISAPIESAGQVQIENLQATARDVRLNSNYQSGTVGTLTGSGLITFASLAKAASVPGLTISALNSSELKVNVDLAIISGSGVARVTTAGPNKINIAVISLGGLSGSDLGSLSNMTITVPGLPSGLTLQSVTVTAQGILAKFAGTNFSFTNSG